MKEVFKEKPVNTMLSEIFGSAPISAYVKAEPKERLAVN